MNESWSSFGPGLIVLGIGLAIGLFMALRMRLGQRRAGAPATAAAGTTSDPTRRDLELERADLEARRAEIYARLRDHEGEDLSEAERRDFELQAARTLKRLEEIDARGVARRSARPGVAGGAGEASPDRRRDHVDPSAAAATAGASAAPARGSRAGLIGFAYGAGFAALVGLLLFWAVRDETPRPPEQETQGPMAGGAPGADDLHARLAQLPPDAQARVSSILARLEEEPNDIDARKALAETFVVEGLFFEAFEQSEKILELRPGDVDGLYFQGLIRLTMGQDSTAIELLDQALASEPGFVSARLVRGIARLRSGQRDGAMEDWRAGLEAAGGKHEGLERLITMAESGASAEEILGSPPPAGGEEPAGDRVAGQPADGAAAGGGAYKVRVELAPGTKVNPGEVLFVNLRIVAGAGPPSAVKRIDSPTFPLDLTLDSSDAMPGLGGRPFPPTGVVSARLDSDGNVSTREDLPNAQSDAEIDKPVTLLLR